MHLSRDLLMRRSESPCSVLLPVWQALADFLCPEFNLCASLWNPLLLSAVECFDCSFHALPRCDACVWFWQQSVELAAQLSERQQHTV